MNQGLRFDYSHTCAFLDQHDWDRVAPEVLDAHIRLHQGTGPGSDSRGWLDLPVQDKKSERKQIKEAAEKIRSTSDVLVVIGIGGSYLGAKAALDMLGHHFTNLLSADKRGGPEIYFVGNNVSSVYIAQLLELLAGKDVSLNVISKSGATLEPAIAFRVFRDWMEKKYGSEGARSRIYVTTDRKQGVLRRLAEREGYESFAIPDDVGGRYSIFTPVGLLPIAVGGSNIDEILSGAADGKVRFETPKLVDNPCYQYAAARHLLHQKGKLIEVLVSYEPRFRFFAEWWKQLFAESEGKRGKGIFPVAAEYSTDLHSIGQYLQDGKRHLFETVLTVRKSEVDVTISVDPHNLDGLQYLDGKGMDEIRARVVEGALLAHTDGGVPNLVVEIPRLTAYHFGELVYFFEKACAISGYLLGVNPFDQPGVDAYKMNMFALLGRPGFEKLKAELEARIRGNHKILPDCKRNI
ncbi:glucose-6-phosphate isomerase [Brevibacillus ruminantium]|uniref:Glucose-6-phosphate isomerase n=1 Tax=Brevibacillus ruminantium TaxID=2950604 RepID=A0ABY4WJN8_9BACL|nr:glucose-6-phosphate isomerase [Brevibacillus ruminantium]USG64871.1 glucose-6-phosphate isomerase [Brevibacillus ruminantium]